MKGLAFLGVLLLALPIVFQVLPANGALQSISEVQSGLVARDSLTTGNTAYWTFYGDAVAQNAPYKYNENSSGLYIGVKAATNGKYAGFYALSPRTSAQLFHAVLTLPFTNIPSRSFNTGLYVQTSAPVVNYVTCYAEVDPGQYYWVVSFAQGNQNQITTETILWTSPVNSTPLTRDCTIITNGQNLLKVYIDGVLVVSSNTMSLNMQSPFLAFLEVQTSYSGAMLWGKYDDYYATTNDGVQVQGAPPGDTAQVVDSKSNVLASATVGSGGVASLDVGRYHLPITGYVQVYDTAHNLVATTGGAGAIWGGDVYQVGTTSTTTSSATSSTMTTVSTTSSITTTTTTATSTTSATTSSTTSTSSSTTPSTSTTSTATTTTTVTTTTPTTTSATTTTATSSSTTVTSTATTATTSGGTSKLTVSTQDLNGTPLTGYYSEVFLNGKKLARGYTPATYTLNNGVTYIVEVDGYGSCPFDYWLDTGSTNNQRSITPTSDTSLTAVLNCGTPITTSTTSTTTATTTFTTTISTSTSTTTTASSTTSSSTTTTVTTTTTSSGGGTSQLTVNTQDTNGAPLTNYYTELYQNNQTIATGYTPAVYTVNNGQTYTVEADGYGSCAFAYWLDTGSTNNLRTISITAATTLTAVLKCGP